MALKWPSTNVAVTELNYIIFEALSVMNRGPWPFFRGISRKIWSRSFILLLGLSRYLEQPPSYQRPNPQTEKNVRANMLSDSMINFGKFWVGKEKNEISSSTSLKLKDWKDVLNVWLLARAVQYLKNLGYIFKFEEKKPKMIIFILSFIVYLVFIFIVRWDWDEDTDFLI